MTGAGGAAFVAGSALPGSAAAGRPASDPAGVVRGGGGVGASLALASRSAASRASRSSRALASRSAASFSAASFWAFWPPLAATIEPICGARVSSVAAMPGSYWRPGLAEGSAPVAATWLSAPGRAFWLVEGEPSNQPQPDRRAREDTPSRPSQRRPVPIMSCCRRIVVTRSKAESKFDPSVVAAYL